MTKQHRANGLQKLRSSGGKSKWAYELCFNTEDLVAQRRSRLGGVQATIHR